MIAADPELAGWLGVHNAKVLERAARHLDLAGEHGAAGRLRHMATAYRMGDASPM